MGLTEIRSKFIEYYKNKEHLNVPSAPLLPENDPTTLFTGSGMQPMIQYFLGEPHPSGKKRIVDSQKCMRSMDIDEVGDMRHTTFFEMLGNWSFGDYWKEEQLKWVFTFLTEELKLDPKKLYVTVFEGDLENGLEKDEESVEIWQKLFKEKGIDAQVGERIFFYGPEKNWWSRSGIPEGMPVGEPGGPDSEVFYKFDVEHDPSFGEKCHPNCDCGKYMEICNSVFMQYKKVAEKKFEPLPSKNIDFGGGLERMTAAVLNSPDIFEIDVLAGAIEIIEKSTGKKYEGENMPPMRVIADHIRGAIFMISEGVVPSNKQQGYVLRRLIRQAAVKYFELVGNTKNAAELFAKIAQGYIEFYGNLYFESLNEKVVGDVISAEIKKFSKSLDKGLNQIEKVEESDIDGKFAFDLYQTYGFPIEVTQEILKKRGVDISMEEFEKAKEEHQEASRTASAGRFKGGLGDDSEKTVWYHTTTHLLHQALRQVLGNHVSQAGSNITPERLRFDFTHDKAMTDEEKSKVEKIVNKKISESLDVTMETMSLDEALESGALAFFKEKYGENVNVYSIGDFSREICGGPHVKNTSEIIGTFKILKEKSNGAGIRRIRAVIE